MDCGHETDSAGGVPYHAPVVPTGRRAERCALVVWPGFYGAMTTGPSGEPLDEHAEGPIWEQLRGKVELRSISGR